MTIVDKLKAVLDLAEEAVDCYPCPECHNCRCNYFLRDDVKGMARALLVLWPALESIERCGGLTLEEKNAATLRLLAAFEQAKKELE